MDLQAAQAILARKKRRAVFRYFKNRYAFLLLARGAIDGHRISEVRKGPFSRLLQKPEVREFVGDRGDGVISVNALEYAWREPWCSFVLDLDLWGGGWGTWQQTSRHGYNLALQLNFSNAHGASYRELCRPRSDHVFNYYGHPVAKRKRRQLYRDTLAWARIDVDFGTGEALIEEIQSDWVRKAKRALACVDRVERREHSRLPIDCAGSPENIKRYLTSIFPAHGECWDEAVLAAAIVFIRDDLRIPNIYFHTADSGAVVKRIRGAHPPRSLYTTLPRKFCFAKTDQAPKFLLRTSRFRRLLRKVKQLHWHRMELH